MNNEFKSPRLKEQSCVCEFPRDCWDEGPAWDEDKCDCVECSKDYYWHSKEWIYQRIPISESFLTTHHL